MIAHAFQVYLVGVILGALYSGWVQDDAWATLCLIWPVAVPVLFVLGAVEALWVLGSKARDAFDDLSKRFSQL